MDFNKKSLPLRISLLVFFVLFIERKFTFLLAMIRPIAAGDLEIIISAPDLLAFLYSIFIIALLLINTFLFIGINRKKQETARIIIIPMLIANSIIEMLIILLYMLYIFTPIGDKINIEFRIPIMAATFNAIKHFLLVIVSITTILMLKFHQK